MIEGEEVVCAVVVADGDAAKVLELVEAPLMRFLSLLRTAS